VKKARGGARWIALTRELSARLIVRNSLQEVLWANPTPTARRDKREWSLSFGMDSSSKES